MEKIGPGQTIERGEKGRFESATLTPERAAELAAIGKAGKGSKATEAAARFGEYLRAILPPDSDALVEQAESLMIGTPAASRVRVLELVVALAGLRTKPDSGLMRPHPGEVCSLCGHPFEVRIPLTREAALAACRLLKERAERDIADLEASSEKTILTT